MSQVRGGVHAPQVSDSPDEIQLSFTELANLDAPALPRQVFLELMSAQGLPTSRAHQLFDGLLGHHRRVLEHFLKACPSAEGQVLRDLKKVAGDQWASLNPTGLCQTSRCS